MPVCFNFIKRWLGMNSDFSFIFSLYCFKYFFNCLFEDLFSLNCHFIFWWWKKKVLHAWRWYQKERNFSRDPDWRRMKRRSVFSAVSVLLFPVSFRGFFTFELASLNDRSKKIIFLFFGTVTFNFSLLCFFWFCFLQSWLFGVVISLKEICSCSVVTKFERGGFGVSRKRLVVCWNTFLSIFWYI